MPEPFCTMCEKCKFLNMGYISALTQASVLRNKNVRLLFKVIAKNTSNISYTARYGLGGNAQLVRNLSFMQIFVIWAEASWKLTISAFFKVQAPRA